MTTPYRRAVVSLAAVMTITLALGACVRASRAVPDAASPLDVHPITIRFDNDARQHVHVYLINESRQWLLGRVEPMMTATLRIPEEALAESSTRIRLAVVAGEQITPQVAHHPRAALTFTLPPSAIVARRWWFAQGRLVSQR